MNIAICAPADITALARCQGVDPTGLALGMGSSPIAPLVEELLKRQHRVTLYTLSYGLSCPVYYDWGELRIFAGPSRRLGAARTLYASEISYLTRTIAADRPDFVNAHWTYEFAMAALNASARTIVSIHDLPWNVLRYFRDRSRTIRLMMAYVIAARARRFTAVSEDAARHFSSYMRPGAKVTVVPNFVPQIVLSKSKGPKTHPGRTLTFATVLQGWTRRKNPQAALRAFAMVRERIPNAQLMMLGTEYEEGGIAYRWARENNVSAGVSFLGCMPYPEMLDFLRDRVDAIVMPSLDEALSMAILENLALGNPIVGGRSTPGVPEQLDSGKTGLLVDVGKPEEIARAMLHLQEEPALYNQLSQRAFQRASKRYSAETVVDQYERVYREFLNS